MNRIIDFYFDFSSPYGYFASHRIEAIASAHSASVHWHPILLGIVFKTTGGMPLPTIPIKGEYSLHDFERTARFHHIPYQKPPVFPIATTAAARAMLWTEANFGKDKAVALARALYHAYFVEGAAINDPAVVVHISTSLDLEPTALAEGMNSTVIREQLKSSVEQAMARGVFGSPFMIVEGEPFWGFDRFIQLDAFLRDGKI